MTCSKPERTAHRPGSNQGPLGPKSDALTTTPVCHLIKTGAEIKVEWATWQTAVLNCVRVGRMGIRVVGLSSV